MNKCCEEGILRTLPVAIDVEPFSAEITNLASIHCLWWWASWFAFGGSQIGISIPVGAADP